MEEEGQRKESTRPRTRCILALATLRGKGKSKGGGYCHSHQRWNSLSPTNRNWLVGEEDEMNILTQSLRGNEHPLTNAVIFDLPQVTICTEASLCLVRLLDILHNGVHCPPGHWGRSA
jgi:hypothetical protein